MELYVLSSAELPLLTAFVDATRMFVPNCPNGASSCL